MWGDTRDDLWLYDTQLDRWSSEALTPVQRREVGRLRSQAAALRESVEAIVALSAKPADQTIERLMAKSDLEPGVEWLLGGRGPP